MGEVSEIVKMARDRFAADADDCGFEDAVRLVCRSVDRRCRIVVLTNLSMGMISLANGIRLAQYYDHAITLVLTPHLWFDKEIQADAEGFYHRYRELKEVESKIRSMKVNVIDLSSKNKVEDILYYKGWPWDVTGIRR
jgi:hypothetical protein